MKLENIVWNIIGGGGILYGTVIMILIVLGVI